MKTFRHILVPTDFSKLSQEALPYALLLAREYKAKLTLLHVISLFEHDPNDPKHRFEAMEEYYKEAEKRAHERANSIVSETEFEIKTVMERGISPHEIIADYTKENNIDLIVMATHGRSGIARILLGSVSEKVIQIAPCPVLIVKKPSHHDLKNLSCSKILVPTDFSDSSKDAMKYALVMAKHFKADILLMHAVEIRFHPAYFAGGVESIFDLDPDLKQRIAARMEAFVQSFDTGGVTVKTSITEGASHVEIVKAARENKSDLIIMSTRGYDEIADYLIGSTTDRVIKRAPCPVFVTR